MDYQTEEEMWDEIARHDHEAEIVADGKREESEGVKQPSWANYRVEVTTYDGRVFNRWFAQAEDADRYCDEFFDSMDTSEARETAVEQWRLGS